MDAPTPEKAEAAEALFTLCTEPQFRPQPPASSASMKTPPPLSATETTVDAPLDSPMEGEPMASSWAAPGAWDAGVPRRATQKDADARAFTDDFKLWQECFEACRSYCADELGARFPSYDAFGSLLVRSKSQEFAQQRRTWMECADLTRPNPRRMAFCLFLQEVFRSKFGKVEAMTSFNVLLPAAAPTVDATAAPAVDPPPAAAAPYRPMTPRVRVALLNFMAQSSELRRSTADRVGFARSHGVRPSMVHERYEVQRTRIKDMFNSLLRECKARGVGARRHNKKLWFTCPNVNRAFPRFREEMIALLRASEEARCQGHSPPTYEAAAARLVQEHWDAAPEVDPDSAEESAPEARAAPPEARAAPSEARAAPPETTPAPLAQLMQAAEALEAAPPADPLEGRIERHHATRPIFRKTIQNKKQLNTQLKRHKLRAYCPRDPMWEHLRTHGATRQSQWATPFLNVRKLPPQSGARDTRNRYKVVMAVGTPDEFPLGASFRSKYDAAFFAAREKRDMGYPQDNASEDSDEEEELDIEEERGGAAPASRKRRRVDAETPHDASDTMAASTAAVETQHPVAQATADALAAALAAKKEAVAAAKQALAAAKKAAEADAKKAAAAEAAQARLKKKQAEDTAARTAALAQTKEKEARRLAQAQAEAPEGTPACNLCHYPALAEHLLCHTHVFCNECTWGQIAAKEEDRTAMCIECPVWGCKSKVLTKRHLRCVQRPAA
tara:strand:+ start:1181 stop:3367 length:2187 start_codon:yes stop_codon:yes gene_type:complete